MKIDLHVHTSERSWCCGSMEREQIEAAIKSGLDAIVITDHNLMVSEGHLERLNKMYAPFRIFGGVEMTLVGKEYRNEDVIVIGVRGRKIEDYNWSEDYAGMHKYVRSKGGFMMLCHPYRYSDRISIDIENYPVDAIEVNSINFSDFMRKRARELGSRMGINRFFSNSDAHSTDVLGRFYNVIDAQPKNEQELAEALLACKHTLVP